MKANENGFTKLPNNLMESIPKIKATATQYELLLIIIRMTFGFHRNTHRLTLSYLEVATNRNKRDIQRALKDLEERRIIFQNTSHNDRYISFNSNTDEWKTKSGKCKRREENPNRVIDQSNDGGLPNRTDGNLPNQEINKENTKDTVDENSINNAYTNKNSRIPDYQEYFKRIWNLYPKKIGLENISELQKEKLYKQVPYNSMVRAINRYKQEIKGVETKFIKNGSTWFNGSYKDYLVDTEQNNHTNIVSPAITYSNYDKRIAEITLQESNITSEKSIGGLIC